MRRITKKIDLQEFGSTYIVSSAFINEIPNIFLDKDYVGEAPNKLGKIEDLEEKYGCSFEILDKLIDQNQLYYQFFDELQHWTSIKIDLRKKVVWYCKQVGGHYACSQPLSNYGKTFWLRKDKSE